MTLKGGSKYSREEISTHTLRGERDLFPNSGYTLPEKFQLTRSVGSVTTILFNSLFSNFISTHTLRGERDEHLNYFELLYAYFNSHAPWGA